MAIIGFSFFLSFVDRVVSHHINHYLSLNLGNSKDIATAVKTEMVMAIAIHK